MTSQGFGAPRRPDSVRRIAVRLRRAGLSFQLVVTAALVLLVLAAGVGVDQARAWVPSSVLLLLLLTAAFLLRLVGTVVVCAVVAAEVVFLELTGRADLGPGALIVYGLAIVAVLAFVRGREKLGLSGAAGSHMLVDLRDRLEAHGRIPSLPAGWRVDRALRSAYAEAFSGDFVVAARAEGGRLLEIALVDVSGKGQAAGVRSLLLSGAFGGLLGAMPHEQFLPAANEYLLRQDWDEGFATAVHFAVCLDSGQFWVSTAGHPPAVHLHAGSGLFEVVDTQGGPVLGVVEEPAFRTHTGTLLPGDALMLYTDGMVETPGSDVDLGIDRLIGVAELVVATRRGGAEAVLAGVRAGDSDDRALVLIYRD
ncbi:PP2C family protein-serine/threonine phosphatase [Pengzhenrongella frigida]|uniref:PP2C family protein-serine/threonine phosphatase n=1 Tax=Pengzhenrongella frigida TaxID=1259133 RepID=UPI001F5C3EB3|nr:PP2C family protein-serine/threonine phosphatase [Cellulomonas sp. HLT2-17]